MLHHRQSPLDHPVVMSIFPPSFRPFRRHSQSFLYHFNLLYSPSSLYHFNLPYSQSSLCPFDLLFVLSTAGRNL